MTKFYIHDVLCALLVSYMFIHRYTSLDISTLWIASLIGLVFVIVRFIPQKTKKIVVILFLLWGIGETFLCILQKEQWIASNHSLFNITGSFGNPGPLGGFLGIIIAGLIDFMFRNYKNKTIFFIYGTIGIVLFWGLILSNSRAGLLASLVGTIPLGLKKFVKLLQGKNRTKVLLFTLLLLIIGCTSAFFIYIINPYSANGRLFIWYNSIKLIKEHPILGWGTGGWTANYMLCQADFFSTHPNSSFMSIADNVSYPYNEIIHIAVNYGLIGIILFISLFISLLIHQQSFDYQKSIKTSLFSFLLFSIFSYPFSIVHLLVLWIFMMASLESKTINLIKISKQIKCFFVITLIATFSSTAIYLHLLYSSCIHDIKYYPYFQHNPDIMFKYAQQDNISINPSFRSEMLLKTAFLYPSSDTYCWLGDDLVEKGEYKKAEYYYKIAMNMTPNRIGAGYKLFKLYLAQEDTLSAIKTGSDVIKKKIKIDNNRSLGMLGEIERILSSLY